jgi:uncharacterized protein (DUF58 family)
MPTLRLNSRLVPVLVVALLALQLAVPHRTWTTLLIGLGGAWLIAYLWARSLARGLRLTREQRFGVAQVGDAIEERFTAANDSWAPALWYEVIDESTLPGYRVSRASGVGAKSSMQWQTEGLCERRGAFSLGPVRVRTGDPFGLYTVEIRYPTTTSVFVLPPIVPLPDITVAPGGRAGEGRPRRTALERTVNASSVRAYVAGDDLRRIHWPTSARRDEYYIRQFDTMPAGDWWIFLDLQASVQAGSGQNSTEEHGVILAASLVDRGLRTGHSVGLVMHGETLVRLPPAAQHDTLRALALAAPGPVPLAHLLTHARPALRELASLILITPNVAGDWIESMLPLMWRGAVPTVLLLDPVSFGGAGSPARVLSTLADLRIDRYLITRDVLDRPEAHPGQQGRWQWRVSPRGRAVLAAQPGDLDWRALG